MSPQAHDITPRPTAKTASSTVGQGQDPGTADKGKRLFSFVVQGSAILALGFLTLLWCSLYKPPSLAQDALPSKPVVSPAQQPAPQVTSHAPRRTPQPVAAISQRQVATIAELVEQLKENHLWEIGQDSVIAPIIFANYPADLQQLDGQAKKRAFLHALLPAAMVASAEITQERERLLNILAKFTTDGQHTTLTLGALQWQMQLRPDEVAFIEKLTRKYRTTDTAELCARVNTLPLSLILAQGAIESNWGTSRFAREGNNLFGVWTWGEKGMVPANRDQGKTHKVAVYDSILDSLRKYLLNINRHDAYAKLRSLRTQSDDPLLLAEGLERYSARGTAYVNDLKRIIAANRLTRYDRFAFPLPLLTEVEQTASTSRKI